MANTKNGEYFVYDPSGQVTGITPDGEKVPVRRVLTPADVKKYEALGYRLQSVVPEGKDDPIDTSWIANCLPIGDR